MLGTDVERLQSLLRELPQVALSTHHYFADGMYARELYRPADTLIVGKVHKREHFYIVMSGEVIVICGGASARINGPKVVVSAPGTKRAVYAVTDATCMTVHRTDSTDLDEIEEELIETDESALFDARNRLKFDVQKFRELTQAVIDGEKPGFWSDWTEEQQQLYRDGKWREFSLSRGYTAEDVARYQAWLDMVKDGLNSGINPHSFTIDLTTKAALANLARAGSHEILKSSHLPFAPRDVP